MSAASYVGAPADIEESAKVLTATSVTRSTSVLKGARTVIKFTVPQSWGTTESEIAELMTAQMRVMWAIGKITDADKGCKAAVGFHNLNRGVSPQYWFGMNTACKFDPNDM
jgi:hypothetical protein